MPDDRHETVTERMDRNWSELLQELRVTQTGTQILTGFLLTVPFQQRFELLDATQRGIYLVLVVLAMLATALLVAPVALHRRLFRKHLKSVLVHDGDLLARAGLLVLALVLIGCTFLLFDVVANQWAATGAAAFVAIALILLWFVAPQVLARRALARMGGTAGLP
nr:DUF6328 family protein [Sanguibacter gelidistatuariae]